LAIKTPVILPQVLFFPPPPLSLSPLSLSLSPDAVFMQNRFFM